MRARHLRFWTTAIFLSLVGGTSSTAWAEPAEEIDPVDDVLATCASQSAPCSEAEELVPLLLRSPDADLRARAARALGMLRHPETRAALETAARYDDDEAVRDAATVALAAFGREGRIRDDRGTRDPDIGRIMYMPTAFSQRKGSASDLRVHAHGLAGVELRLHPVTAVPFWRYPDAPLVPLRSGDLRPVVSDHVARGL